MSTVDLTPVFQAVIGLIALVVGTVGTWALTRLAKKLGIETTQGQQAQIEAVVNKSVQAAAVAAEGLAKERGWDHPEVKSAVLSGAANYAVTQFSATLKQAGVDPNNPVDAANLRTAIQRALPASMTPVVASPVTTNGPAI